MPMIAIIARRPFASSADNFLVFSVKTYRVAGRQDLEAEVARCGWGAGRLVLRNLAECHVGKNLTPTCGRNLGNRSKAVGDVRKFKASAWGKITRELARDPC